MHRSKIVVVWFCAVIAMAAGCGSDDGNGGGTAGVGAAGVGAAGAGAAGAGAAGTGAAGMGTPGTAPNMPDATCLSMAGTDNPSCSACACTPNAAGGCLDQITACQGSADPMLNMLCSAIIACARANGCTGQACLQPCMAEITAGFQYMQAAPTTAATAVGDCTSTSCAAAGCPTGM